MGVFFILSLSVDSFRSHTTYFYIWPPHARRKGQADVVRVLCHINFFFDDLTIAAIEVSHHLTGDLLLSFNMSARCETKQNCQRSQKKHRIHVYTSVASQKADEMMVSQ